MNIFILIDRLEIKSANINHIKCIDINGQYVFLFHLYRVDTTDFAKKVRKYNQLAPFNFTSAGFDILNQLFTIHISIYAAHLYDSAMLYAKALDTLIREKQAAAEAAGEDASELNVGLLARDGEFVALPDLTFHYFGVTKIANQSIINGFELHTILGCWTAQNLLNVRSEQLSTLEFMTLPEGIFYNLSDAKIVWTT